MRQIRQIRVTAEQVRAWNTRNDRKKEKYYDGVTSPRIPQEHRALLKMELQKYCRKIKRLDPRNEYWHLRPDNLDSLITELERYFCLRLLCPNTVMSPSRQVDDAWHCYILMTKQYRKFCDDTFGEYLDHEPGVREFQTTLRVLEEFKDLTVREYGEVDLDAWADRLLIAIDPVAYDYKNYRTRHCDTGSDAYRSVSDDGSGTDESEEDAAESDATDESDAGCYIGDCG